ncbi:MAG: 50S ribosome-binding GTPase [Nanoarchaeota archaeon]|nr:50S ribosome-binding GTPase [Nanoarchaeota archaeon]MBU1027968.1 50S ribosome-binding GTPase [Nanoarchaeota archaeon]
MPINAHPEFLAAEKEYIKVQTLEEKIEKLKKMISLAPSHKGGENLKKQLTTRRKKLEQQLIKSKKSGKSTFKGIKKEDMQIVIIGKTNTGKSSLLNTLTNAYPKISEINFTTKQPIIGMMNLETINMQLIENPAIESSYYDKGLTNSADTLLILITNLNQIKEIEKYLDKTTARRIIVFNIKEYIDTRKLKATLKSKKYNFVIINIQTKENFEELKSRIIQSFNKIRVYTKEPGKEKSKKPIILKPNLTVKDVAEKILHGFSKQVSETKIWGPSSKFPGQKVGLKHKLKDLDVVEFKTR